MPTHADLRCEFRWEIPARYNSAAETVDRHAALRAFRPPYRVLERVATVCART